MPDDLTAYLIRHGSDWLPQYPCCVPPASATLLADILRANETGDSRHAL